MQAEHTQNITDWIVHSDETETLWSPQIEEESAEGNKQPTKLNGRNAVKPVFGQVLSSVKKRINKIYVGTKNFWEEIFKLDS
jgi:hypothetical protein